MTDFAWLPPQYREHAAEFQGEELDRSQRQENTLRSEPYLKGWFDCADGIPHESGKGRDYDAGYSDSYAHEENRR